MDIKVKNCTDCPFSSWGHGGRIGNGSDARRLIHRCNLQKSATQWKEEGMYDCFDNCPLKESGRKVEIE